MKFKEGTRGALQKKERRKGVGEAAEKEEREEKNRDPTGRVGFSIGMDVKATAKGAEVWFQNRRSKERRMKQLSSMGARRHFFRSPRRAMRPLRPGMSPDGLDDSPDMVSGPNSGYTYFSDSGSPGDFGYGAQPGFYDFFPGQPPPDGMAYHGVLGPGQNVPPPPTSMEQPLNAVVGPAPQFQLHEILWVAVSSTVGHRVERRHHLQSVCLQDVVLVDQTDEKSGWSVLQHPPYSPDLGPSDFYLFGPLKQHLGGKHFADDDDVQHDVLLWMGQQPKEFYAAGIGALLKRWDKCINIGGDYVKK
ncbi:hypothetical protein AVEN_135431-1 [Araneus ventricosus]|uniref:Homeobox domain-containing protein n=1 Tax=Araneus ventricosus TaxID=182803 RepID=A0A4Y2BCM9_ARAVE|nr:hypothetical protein AVEN_135431-1 [Araneus ventricosus]